MINITQYRLNKTFIRKYLDNAIAHPQCCQIARHCVSPFAQNLATVSAAAGRYSQRTRAIH